MAKVDFPTNPADGAQITVNGMKYQYYATKGVWKDVQAVNGNATATPPENPYSGQLWFNTTNAVLYVYYEDGTSSQWVGISGPAGADGTSSAITASSNPPASPGVGDLWFDDSDATLNFYYDDGSSQQWVTTSGPAGGDGADGKTFTGPNAPSTPSEGDLWWNSTTGKLLIRYSSAWITATTPGRDGVDAAGFSALDSDLVPANDSSISLGSPTKKWKSLYLSANTMYLGDSGSISAGAGGEISMAAMKIGSGENTVKLGVSASGEFETRKVTGGVVAAAKPAGTNAVTNFSDLAALTDNSAGNTVLVTSTKKVYMYDGTGWYLVATMVNNPPGAITGVSDTYLLETDGTVTTITAISTDPEGFPLTWSHAVTAGSLTNGGGTTATVTQVDNVFTITPSTVEAYVGTFSLTFNVTDGVNASVSKVSAITLAFYTYVKPTINTFYTGSSTGTPTIHSQSANNIEFNMPCGAGSYFSGGRTANASVQIAATGKVYFEIECTGTDGFNDNTMWTFSRADWSTAPNAFNGATNSTGWVYTNGFYYPTSGAPTVTTAFTDFAIGADTAGGAERVGIAYDMDGASGIGEWWFRKGQSAWSWGNPTSAGSGYTSTNSGTEQNYINAWFSTGSGSNQTKKITFYSKLSHTYAAPSGYTAL